MQNVFENLINGNLADAKRLARRFSVPVLYAYALREYGWAAARAAAAVHFLKCKGSFQAYCDAR